MPRVSIVVPTYNRATLLPYALDSALAQTCTDIEILVVDDGSTDGTQEVLSRYAGRIVPIRRHHRGVAAARNEGVRAATGELITFLDSDDLLSPVAVASQAAFLDARPDASIVYCGWQMMDATGTRILNAIVPTDHPDMTRALVTHGVFYPPPMITGATTVRRQVFSDVAFDESAETGEDVLLWTRLAIAGHRFACNPQALYLWRETVGSLGRDLDAIESNVELGLARLSTMLASSPEKHDLLPVAAANIYLGIGNQFLRSHATSGDDTLLERALLCASKAIGIRPTILREKVVFVERLVLHGLALPASQRKAFLQRASRLHPTRTAQRRLYHQLQAAVHTALAADARARRAGVEALRHAIRALAHSPSAALSRRR